MGTKCCEPVAQDNENFQVYGIPKINEYYETNLPHDQYLLSLIPSSKYINKYNNGTLKHKIYDRWYWGKWQNGQPIGKGAVYIKQPHYTVFYEGDFKGEPHGIGKAIFNEGEYEYEGQIQCSKANGEGVLRNNKDDYMFEGTWKDSKPFKGILKLHPQQSLLSKILKTEEKQKEKKGEISIFLNEKMKYSKIVYPDGRIYEGQIDKIKYLPHGYGKAKFHNQSSYSGDWQEGMMHGKGTFKWMDGSSYEGDYLFGKKHGSGRFFFRSGNYYEGYWADGKQNGKGLLYDKDSNQLKNGYWRDGIYQGKRKEVVELETESK